MRQTKLRREMWEWINGPGQKLRDPLSRSTNYLSAYDRNGNLIRVRRSRDPAALAKKSKDGRVEKPQSDLDDDEISEKPSTNEDGEERLPKERLADLRPYPQNQHFRSQPVLSEDLREEVFKQVVTNGVDISTVSAAFSIDMRRVAAVVRLKTIEKRWQENGKPLASAYNKAVLSMLPQTPFTPRSSHKQIHPHESINDIPVHSWTRQQIFYPTSESRQFTREDAARVFDETLLPADKRIPHPELIVLEKEQLEGVSREQRWERQQARDAAALAQRQNEELKKRKFEQQTQRTVPGRRWDFKFQDISAEQTGKDGRNPAGVGIRYGVPQKDRKINTVKIPTSVE